MPALALRVRGAIVGGALVMPAHPERLPGFVLCEWFARCTHPAAGTVWHPILGDVPTCRRCAETLDLDLKPYTERAT